VVAQTRFNITSYVHCVSCYRLISSKWTENLWLCNWIYYTCKLKLILLEYNEVCFETMLSVICLWTCSILLCLFVVRQPPLGHGLLIHEVSLSRTQRRTTVSRTPLDEWSACRRHRYLTTHNTHNRQTSMPPVGFEPTISAGEWPQTHA